MIPVSDAYKELVKSNIRPKCEPVIKVFGLDDNGNEVELIWQAKNIKDMTFKRGIDPVGRELPYLELTWTEIYTGEFNETNYPEKYNNIAKYMEVELSFVQDLGFYNTWKTFLKGGTNWKDMLSKTWKQIKNSVSQETIKMPKMFLSAKPIVNGQTITWTARDFLSFLDKKIIKSYGDFYYSVPFTDPLVLEFSNFLFPFENLQGMYNVILKTIENVNQPLDFEDFIDRVVNDGNFKSFILNWLNLNTRFWIFQPDGSLKYAKLDDMFGSSFTFSKKIMYNLPEITFLPDISSYEFKNYVAAESEADNYSKSYDLVETVDDYSLYYFYFKKYGVALKEYNSTRWVDSEINYAISDVSTPITVTPINVNFFENKLHTGLKGEIFTEDNPLNFYKSNSKQMIDRFEFLKQYFNSKNATINFECLPVLFIDLGDGVNCETNTYFQNGEEAIKRGLIVAQEIKYNGALKQKNIFHEFPIGLG